MTRIRTGVLTENVVDSKDELSFGVLVQFLLELVDNVEIIIVRQASEEEKLCNGTVQRKNSIRRTVDGENLVPNSAGSSILVCLVAWIGGQWMSWMNLPCF